MHKLPSSSENGMIAAAYFPKRKEIAMDMNIVYVAEPPVYVVDNEANPLSNPCRYNVAVTKSNDVILHVTGNGAGNDVVLASIAGESPEFIVSKFGNLDEDLLFKSADDLYEHGFEDAAKYVQLWAKLLEQAKQDI